MANKLDIDHLLRRKQRANYPALGVLFALGVVLILALGWAWSEGGRW